MEEYDTPRILSIQSHVVAGYVGNKSATFPLQLLGFEVDAINSVQLSNHTGYKVIKGQVLNSEDLVDLMDGLIENNIDHYTHLLTGYVGSASFLRQIAQVVQKLKSKNPKLLYVCDPVMGDNGKMYVPEELKEIYKNEIIPLADIITPNHFELELLLNRKIHTLSEIKDSLQELHKLGIRTIAVSSTYLDGKLISIVSSTTDEVIKIEIPQISAIYTGSGDLYAALFLAHSYLQNNLKLALENTINSLHDVLLKTYEYSLDIKNRNMQDVRKIELRLIQSKRFIENPSNKLQAEII
ncbi:PREDICTED: pyridoxal kinase [Ceratosolen solmsi marchali]|uniref:Pyridoxal kinase n=1 Tax=Ceratosolen solmsi marchali TaxID=326594 RepID=A0AAJ6YIH7_9HYME|nr:PREDICTED: pyridoxal kinase [Ceratosolen solmsi marchali]